MAWLILFLVAVVTLIVAGSRRMRIPREPQREGPEDARVVKGYDRLCGWPIMKAERYLALRALRKLHPMGKLIDIGCGPGYLVNRLSRMFPDLQIIGIDINQDMLHQAVSNFPSIGNVQFREGDAQALPFPDEEVDVIVSTGAFHHWDNGPRSLREFHRVLKPGGQFLILDLRRDARWLFYWLVKMAQVFMPADIKRVNGAVGSVWSSYTVGEMGKLLKESPFSVWRLKPALGWMFIYGTK